MYKRRLKKKLLLKPKISKINNSSQLTQNKLKVVLLI